VPCRFCQKSVCPQGHNECLTKIPPARVVDAVCGLLDLEPEAVPVRLLLRENGPVGAVPEPQQ
jgi:hypothetical protein